MANYVIVKLDTTGPSNPSLILDGGADFATNELVTAAISTGDTTITNYQMKIWGDVNPTFDVNVQKTEGESSWIVYNSTKQLKLALGNTQKTINVKVRDEVYNESAIASDTITLNLSLPTVTTGSPDVTEISAQPGKDTFSFSFYGSEDYVEFKVKVVTSANSKHDTGTLVGNANGSTGTFGAVGYLAGVYQNVTIKGADLATASALDGDKIVKVFIKNQFGDWSA